MKDNTSINGISLESRKYATTLAGQSTYDLNLEIENIKNKINDPKYSNNFAYMSNLKNRLNELEIQKGAMAFTVVSNVLEMANQGKTTEDESKKININGLFERFKVILKKGAKDENFKNSEEYQSFLESLDENLTVPFGGELKPIRSFFEENSKQICKFSKSMYGEDLDTDRIRKLNNSITTQACLPDRYSNLLSSIIEDIKDLKTEEEFDDLMVKKYEEYLETVKDNKETTKNNTKDTVISGVQMGAAALAAVFPPLIVVSAILFYFKTNNKTPLAEFVNKRINNFKNGIASIGNKITEISDNAEKDRNDKEKKEFDEAQEVKKEQRNEIEKNIEELDLNGNFEWLASIKREDTKDISKLMRLVLSKMNFSAKNIETLMNELNANEPVRSRY